jgi:hypothetical protein
LNLGTPENQDVQNHGKRLMNLKHGRFSLGLKRGAGFILKKEI